MVSKEVIQVRILLIAVIIIAVLASPVCAVGRMMSLEADGRIEYNTSAKSPTAKTGLDVRGEGQVSIANDGDYTRGAFDQSYVVDLRSEEDATKPLQAVTAGWFGDSLYALMVAPQQGEAGQMEIDYEIENNGFTASNVSAEAVVTDGEFRSHLHLRDAVRDLTLHEEIRVRGHAWFVDYITVSAVDLIAEE